jgi:hypothetical protein
LISFVLSLARAIWVLLPHEFVFAFRGEALLAESDHRGVPDVTEAYRAAGLWAASLRGIPKPRPEGWF